MILQTKLSNRQWRLRQPIAAEELPGPQHFEFSECSIPQLQDGEVLLRTLYLGTSPAQRAYLTQASSMHNKVAAGEVMRGRGVAVVESSRAQDFVTGDIVIADLGWQDYSVHSAGGFGLAALNKRIKPPAPLSLCLGILGAAAYTAYFGLLDVGKLKSTDTVLVSGAAGGVGSCAVQIAKAMGCRVIGIAGGARKCKWLVESFAIDEAIDYHSSDLGARLAELCPDGVDVVFDNVGGEQLNTFLAHLAIGARVVICGYISTDYSAQDSVGVGLDNYTNLLSRRARMQGFFVFDYADMFPQADAQLQAWYAQGLLKDNTDALIGLENMPSALQSLFTGGNMGVRICQVAERVNLGENDASNTQP